MKNFTLRANIGMRILKLLPKQVINSMQADEIEHYKFNLDNILIEYASKLECEQSEPVKEAQEMIPNDVVTKMQHEFEPHPDSTFKQGMYSGYAFGLQDGYRYAMQFSHPETEKEKLKKELIKFKVWFENLSPASKCTVHPPAGSGGCYGLYTMSDDDLIDEYLNSQTKRQ
jgi:hypothetical protein